MRFPFIALCLCSAAFAATPTDVEAPWERHTFNFESGLLWQIGNNTPIDYVIAQSQFSWSSPYVLRFNLDDGSTFVVRNHASLIAAWIAEGPEDHYFGFSGAPSLEWWSASNDWSLYFSIGGGFGVINSTDVVGGQGQDFTLNWFAKTGARFQVNDDLSVFCGPFFQHMSNGGATDPNPGIDALGVTFGLSLSF